MLDTFGEYCVILTSIAIIVFVKFLITPAKAPILNIYRTPSSLFWIKVGIMYIIFYIKKISKASTAPNKNFENLDKPQKLPTHEHAMDGVYFNGSSIQGDRFSMAMNRRNGNEIETYIFVKIASLEGTLVNVDNPNASLNKGEDDSFSAEGFNIVSIIPTKKWKITYNGKMKNAENAQIHNVHLNLDFFSNLSIFDYGTDFDHLSHAKALALELWSGAYFDILKEFHLMCYGQFGKLKGKISVDGKEYELKLDSYRDHTVADNFNWATYHRYITHYINVENGDRFVITKLSQPVVTSNFSQGFMYNASDKKYYPLQKCNLELYQHGETEKPPVDYAFLFAAGGREFTIQIKVEDSIPAYLGKNWDCKLLERFCSADVNGKKVGVVVSGCIEMYTVKVFCLKLCKILIQNLLKQRGFIFYQLYQAYGSF